MPTGFRIKCASDQGERILKSGNRFSDKMRFNPNEHISGAVETKITLIDAGPEFEKVTRILASAHAAVRACSMKSESPNRL
jgi:hypothetical protein